MIHKQLLYIVFSLLLLLVGLSRAQRPCTLQNYNGDFYDFSALTSIKDYTIANNDQDIFYFNICKDSAFCDTKYPGSATCHSSHWEPGVPYANIGQTGSMTITPLAGDNKGGQIQYTNGSYCSDSLPIYRKVTIAMRCSDGPTTLNYVGESSTCVYYIEMSSSLACPTSSSLASSTSASSTGTPSFSTTGNQIINQNTLSTSGGITGNGISISSTVGTSTGLVTTSSSGISF
ncbi:hypothetical protein PPL_11362 [Heterostelium album PN500]|uniref:MRH domain-containing protein n=1 Tax=Heterostelium pallidum (strain ATCC 26659 / Pp 5 / PN500) TaxID=670386 RepID=D3BT69_HETP5|nr:hypothetical protein PPL_11362 [Heterostelium album PN500]EFA75286.1 hypothetical protein PPL_11362 [Heterostelium album PN500]|eukprot:XP_020427420.1 hypothetical protein PPL_11362 [Heterostelium album PN500]